MNTMGSQHRQFKKTQTIHQTDGSHAVFICHILYFCLCLGQVYVYSHIQLPGQANHLFKIVRRAGVRGVGAKPHVYPAVCLAVPLCNKIRVEVQGCLSFRANTDHTPGEIGPHTGPIYGLGHLIHAEVHISKGGGS